MVLRVVHLAVQERVQPLLSTLNTHTFLAQVLRRLQDKPMLPHSPPPDAFNALHRNGDRFLANVAFQLPFQLRHHLQLRRHGAPSSEPDLWPVCTELGSKPAEQATDVEPHLEPMWQDVNAVMQWCVVYGNVACHYSTFPTASFFGQTQHRFHSSTSDCHSLRPTLGCTCLGSKPLTPKRQPNLWAVHAGCPPSPRHGRFEGSCISTPSAAVLKELPPISKPWRIYSRQTCQTDGGPL